MYQKSLYDITEVCKMLDTTSRTLRFYEEKGIIQSTTVGISSRRQYNEKQISRIKNVFVLRTLGLSVKAIVELQTKGIDLKDAVLCVYDDISHFGYKIDTTDPASIYTHVDFPSELISNFANFIRGE